MVLTYSITESIFLHAHAKSVNRTQHQSFKKSLHTYSISTSDISMETVNFNALELGDWLQRTKGHHSIRFCAETKRCKNIGSLSQRDMGSFNTTICIRLYYTRLSDKLNKLNACMNMGHLNIIIHHVLLLLSFLFRLPWK